MAAIVLDRGSKKILTGSVRFEIGNCFIVLAFYLLSLTSYKVIKLFVASTKLKSSPKTKLMA